MPEPNKPATAEESEFPIPPKSSLPSSKPQQGRIYLAMVCTYAMLIYAMYFGAFGVMLPHIGQSFGLGTEAEGRLFPANFSGFIIGVLLSGILSDRIGRRLALFPASLVYALGLLLTFKADNFGLILFASALIGAGSGSMEVIASAFISDLFPEKRAFALNGIQVVFGFGAAVSPFVAHRLLSRGTSWQSLYLVFGALTLALFLWLFFVKSDRSATKGEALDLVALKAIIRKPDFIALCLMQLFYVGAETGFFTWMPTYFEKSLPGGKQFSGLVVSVFWFAMTVGRFGVGFLIGKVRLMRLNVYLALGGVVGGLMAVAVLNPYFVLFSVALVGLSFSGIFGIVLAEAAERYPNVAGTVFGAIVSSCGVGGAVLPWAIGALSETSIGWRGALLLVPFFSLVVIGLSLYLAKRDGR